MSLCLENVLDFCDHINSECGYVYSFVLLSVFGIVFKLRELVNKYTNKVQLAVSLYSAFQDVRSLINLIPLNSSFELPRPKG